MNLKLLLAEDDDDLRQTLVEALEMEGFDVYACVDAEEAIEAAENDRFDLALLDMIMPGATGIEAISNIVRSQPNIGIVISTAFGTVATAVDAMKKGAHEFISKPFDLESLVMTLKRVHAQRTTPPSLAGEKADKVFAALANPIRRQTLLKLMVHKRLRFMDLCRLVEVDNHTRFNFHIRQLKQASLVEQSESKVYFLTTEGKKLCASLFSEQN
ncbi:response regulator [Paraferrimonas haliotis]|uniref:Response regulatory domain-containing protein n=1 Tax=Paraferrimonas haliotis TaxID=2013866 RepID=A0AA37TXL5_9GAMM|nr:response regulator [Paraferrimonas haliotis]GLS84250.1 hypothetical protein GCM10007894_22270 [Paraferrimonas haliotis]